MPDHRDDEVLGELAETAFRQRRIRLETAGRFGVYTGSRDNRTGDVFPDAGGNIVVFPYYEGGRRVGEKYRAPGKRFWQSPGGTPCFWNVDCLDDPELQEGRTPLLITEGELDALTAIDCGFKLTVSVPDGAPPVRKGESPDQVEEVDPANEPNGKFKYIWRARDKIKRIKRFVLAVDDDDPGKRLEAELLRRLSPARCSKVTYPEGCKDLSDVLTKFGPKAVAEVINTAKPYAVPGVHKLEDYADQDIPQTFVTGLPDLDDKLRLWPGELIVLTGRPGSGKSTFLVNLCASLAREYGWASAIASLEVPVMPMLRHKLRLAGSVLPPGMWSKDYKATLDRWINNMFLFIENRSDEEEESMSVEWLLDRARDAVMMAGIRVLVIDPWNEVEHSRPRGESESDYQNRAIRMIRRFALECGVIVIIAAHPTKEAGKEEGRVPSLYDVSGSAAWANKPDHGIVIDVPDPKTNETVVWIKKVRFSWSGQIGHVTYNYDPETETYTSMGDNMPIWQTVASIEESKRRGSYNARSRSDG